ncbi:MAG: type II toxin-antitoxin system HicB family antitoxin [Terriglobia bacterium]
MKIDVVLEPSDEGGYTAYVPSLPDCISEGENVQDALRNIQEAIGLYRETLASRARCRKVARSRSVHRVDVS